MIWRDGDDGAIRAAFVRAANLEAYEGITAPGRLAAAVAVSIGRHRHPLVDGNKRAAALALETVLILHDLTLDVSNRDLEAHIRTLVETPDVEAFEIALADWITPNAISF